MGVISILLLKCNNFCEKRDRLITLNLIYTMELWVWWKSWNNRIRAVEYTAMHGKHYFAWSEPFNRKRIDFIWAGHKPEHYINDQAA